VQRSADALLGIINDILDYSKIEAGKLEVQADDTPIRELIEECVQLHAKAASTKGLELVLDIDPDVPDWLRLDPLRFRQILNNLIGNGIKFTHEGEVVIVVDRVHEPEKGAFLRTLVRDTGIGIRAEEQKHLFNAFMQADGSTSRKYGGTGLGLAISKRLGSMMNGSLDFSSKAGQGSAFWLDLPLIHSEGEDFLPERNRVAPGLRVLLVDDHEQAREVVSRQLRHLGCDVTSLGDMAAGLKRIRESHDRGRPYDFAIVEAEHSGMTGVEFCEKVRADRSFKELRLFLMSDVGFRNMPCCDDVYRVYKPACSTQLRRLLEKYQPETPAAARQDVKGDQVKPSDGGVLPMRILVVEDSPVNQQVSIGMLERMGHKVFLAENGLQALELLRSEPVELVLMDCQMPEMDGYACTRAIRQGYHGVTCTDVPIIAMTAYAMKGDQKKCLDAGMNDYLAKPVRMADLSAMLQRVQTAMA
ncbi:MAG: response regulator, partial [Puniceicoccales bacterium]